MKIQELLSRRLHQYLGLPKGSPFLLLTQAMTELYLSSIHNIKEDWYEYQHAMAALPEFA